MFLAPETELGPFEIVRLLGVGGMGEVYAARDRQLNRSVALKVLRADIRSAPPSRAVRAGSSRRLGAESSEHLPHLPARRDTDGRPYIAMEYVEGQTLGQRLVERPCRCTRRSTSRSRSPPPSTAAHAAGIVHRDIKPGNMMVRPDRLVKVLDFGLAKLVPSANADARQRPTLAGGDRAGIVIGTPDYMSPEQARGQAVDARTDIWALGVLLYEMVAHRHPFAGSTRADVLVSVLDHEPASLTDLAPHVPAELQRIVRKALRKDPEQRYQGMKDLLLDLEVLRDEVGGGRSRRDGPAEDRGGRNSANPRPLAARRVLDSWGVLGVAAVLVLGYSARWTSTPIYTRAAAERRTWSGRQHWRRPMRRSRCRRMGPCWRLWRGPVEDARNCTFDVSTNSPPRPSAGRTGRAVRSSRPTGSGWRSSPTGS